jgi:hypothetical protein
MILSTHAIFGAAVASLVPTHPVFGFSLGFISHFALDAIPHRDYELISVEIDSNNKMELIETVYKKFRLIRDMTVVSLDAILGLIFSFLFFFNPAYPYVFFWGVIGALIPDFLTFLYLILKHKTLGVFYNFHASFIHSKVILGLNQLAGVFLQFCTIGLLIAIIYSAKYFLI